MVIQVCGCESREEHVNPCLDVDLGIGHGERAERCGDPGPYEVPGTGGWNGVYTESPDIYCMCGHPGYTTCSGWLGGYGVMGVTVERTD